MEEAEEIVQNASIWEKEWTQDSFDEWLETCTTENRPVSHSALGIITFIIHNLIVIMSFGRSRSDSVRNIQVIIHSHLGYLVPILSGIYNLSKCLLLKTLIQDLIDIYFLLK